MDWRESIRRELRDPRTTVELRKWFERFSVGDPVLVEALRSRGTVSFPHTALAYSGEMTIRTVTSLYAAGMKRVIAIGVLHQGALSPSYAEQFAELLDPTSPPAVRRKRAETFRGGFIREEGATPFGDVPILPGINGWNTIRRNDPLLADEFSLDYFLALVRLSADWLGVEPLSVFPVYIGVTFDPVTGLYELAHAISTELAGLLDDRTAMVVTGDVVHYGTTYSDAREMEGMPTDAHELERHFLPLVQRAYELAFHAHNYPEAFRYFNDILHNDQRFLFPVVAELLGPRTKHEVIQFKLSDYAPIWNVRPPSLVASSLIVLWPTRSN